MRLSAWNSLFQVLEGHPKAGGGCIVVFPSLSQTEKAYVLPYDEPEVVVDSDEELECQLIEETAEEEAAGIDAISKEAQENSAGIDATSTVHKEASCSTMFHETSCGSSSLASSSCVKDASCASSSCAKEVSCATPPLQSLPPPPTDRVHPEEVAL